MTDEEKLADIKKRGEEVYPKLVALLAEYDFELSANPVLQEGLIKAVPHLENIKVFPEAVAEVKEEAVIKEA